MRPNFALILSMEGIALLQRSAPGWSFVGEANPESPRLSEEMAALRRAADRLAPEGATFKVVVPNDQIRFVTIPAGVPDPKVRQKAIEDALDGATPYALDELAIDSTVSGETLQIAAVALETLQEADDFARGYGFKPVSFVALPEPRDFGGEPFFGTAHDVPDSAQVERDRIAMRITGRITPPPEDEPVGETAPEVAEEDDTPVAFSSVRSRRHPAPPPPPKGPDAEVEGDAPDPDPLPDPKVTSPRIARDEEIPAPASLSDTMRSPETGAEPQGTAVRPRSLLSRLFGRFSGGKAREAAAERSPDETSDNDADGPTARDIVAPLALPETAVGIARPEQQVKPAEEPAPAPKPATGKRKAKAAANPAPAPVAPDPIAEPVVPVMTAKPRTPGALSAEERRAEEERLTVFGARGGVLPLAAQGRPWGAVALVIALFLAGTAAWSMLFSGPNMAALLRSDTEEPAPAPVPDSGDEEQALAPPAPLTPAGEAPEEQAAAEPIPDATPVPEEVTPAEPEAEEAPEPVSPLIVTEAAPEVSPETAEETAPPAATDPAQDSAQTDALTEERTPGTPDTPPRRNPEVELAVLLPDTRPGVPPGPPVPGQRFDMDDRGLVIATPDGAETPSGTVVFAGRPPVVQPARPGEPERAPAADGAPSTETQDSGAAGSDASLRPGDLPDAIRPRARPGTTETAVAQAETESAAPADASAGDNTGGPSGASLASGVIEPGANVTAFVEIAAQRSSVAAGLAAAVRNGAVDPDTAEVIEAQPELEPTFVALRPRQRPGNIGELAAAAAMVQEPPPSVTPVAPTRASVAREATLSNAIDLSQINLIGVYGQQSDRRALVRLSNGRYRKVKVGDRIDGGRVLAIGQDTLRYQKNGRNVTLDMPSG